MKMDGYRQVVVVAGNAREADEWRRAEGLKGRDWIYAGGPRSIEGIRPTRVVVLPGFSNHRYWKQIEQVIMHAIAKSKTLVEIERL